MISHIKPHLDSYRTMTENFKLRSLKQPYLWFFFFQWSDFVIIVYIIIYHCYIKSLITMHYQRKIILRCIMICCHVNLNV